MAFTQETEIWIENLIFFGTYFRLVFSVSSAVYGQFVLVFAKYDYDWIRWSVKWYLYKVVAQNMLRNYNVK